MTPQEHIAKAVEYAERPMTSVDGSMLNAAMASAHADIARAMIELQSLRDEHGVAVIALDTEHSGLPQLHGTLPVEDRCPHCGGEPPEMDDHRDDCPTLGSCAQCRPETPRPWHPESEWWPDGAVRYGDALDAHMREAHRT